MDLARVPRLMSASISEKDITEDSRFVASDMLDEFTLNKSPRLFARYLVRRNFSVTRKVIHGGSCLAENVAGLNHADELCCRLTVVSLGGELSAKLPHLIGQIPYEIDQR